MYSVIARLSVPVSNITVVTNKFVPIFSYFIKLSPHGQVNKYIQDRCHITLSLSKTDS